MGYQVVFNYHKRKDSGYDLENTNKITKKVGRDDEDTPLEQVVMLVKSQLARRDILVTDVEVYEFVKKKIKFKEVKGGFIIKDKKFLMDQIQGVPVATDDDDAPQMQQQLVHPHEMMQMPQFQNLPPQQLKPQAATPLNVKPQVSESGVPVPLHPQRFEVFDPDPRWMSKLNNTYKLTPGKKYPIYREWSEGIPPLNVTKYLIKDDRNMETTISAEYFVAAGRGLIGGNFDADPVERSMNRGLSFQGQFLEDHGGSMQGQRQPVYMDSDEVPAELMRMPDISQLRGRI